MSRPARPRTAAPDATPTLRLDDLQRAVIDSLYDGVYFVDRGRRIRYWNRGAEQLSGYASADVVGHRCFDNILNHVDASGTVLCRSLCPLAATMRDGEPREAQVFLRHRAGHRVPVEVRTVPVLDRGGETIGAVEIFRDATDLSGVRRELSELRDMAMQDALTGLPNRRHFDMSISSRVAELAGYGRRFGLLLADLDEFKRVNDAHGHAIGDLALRTVGQTLLASSRPSDDIARIGGEEFAILVSDVDGTTLREVAERFRALVERTRVRAGTRSIGLTTSIGAAPAEVGDTAESIFDRADAALYAAKDGGRNRVSVAG
jgi:diguanylate cyclase (GGDEF)-like protein/PAS domain S-box-containing protein